MKKLLVLVVLCALGWTTYTRHAVQAPSDPPPESTGVTTPPTFMPVVPAQRASPEYSCDGRTYCSQMSSCAEAKYFLAHCPGVKMDGDGDGIPCERQWCNDG